MAAMMQMLIASGNGFVVVASPANSTDFELSPTDAVARITFNTDGSVDELNAAGFQLVRSGNPADLEIFVSGTGDTPTGSALDTWLSLGSARSFELEETGVGTLQFSGTYQVRIAASGQVLGSASFGLSATSDI